MDPISEHRARAAAVTERARKEYRASPEGQRAQGSDGALGIALILLFLALLFGIL